MKRTEEQMNYITKGKLIWMLLDTNGWIGMNMLLDKKWINMDDIFIYIYPFMNMDEYGWLWMNMDEYGWIWINMDKYG